MTRQGELKHIARECGGVLINPTGCGHPRILLPNGRTVIVSMSPSNVNFIHAVRRDIRRALQEERTP